MSEPTVMAIPGFSADLAAPGGEGLTWPALVRGFLPIATMAGVTVAAPKPRKLVDCRDATDCSRLPFRTALIGEHSNPFGPSGAQGWSAFGSVANQRYYAFPATERYAGRTWADEWQWGAGVQLDTRRLFAADASSETLSVLTEVGAGFDDHRPDTPYQLRTRMIIGRGGPGLMLYAIGEVGIGSGDPANGSGGDLYGRASLGLRF